MFLSQPGIVTHASYHWPPTTVSIDHHLHACVRRAAGDRWIGSQIESTSVAESRDPSNTNRLSTDPTHRIDPTHQTSAAATVSTAPRRARRRDASSRPGRAIPRVVARRTDTATHSEAARYSLLPRGAARRARTDKSAASRRTPAARGGDGLSRLDRVGDEVARGERVRHAARAHRDRVRDADRVEAQRDEPEGWRHVI